MQFVDDGNEVAPSVSVKVNDGAIDSNVLAATINYTPANDTPVVTSVALTINEGQTVTLSGANFGITDPDNASFTYTASAVTGGFFQLSSAAGTPITTFTSADLSGGLVQFVDDGDEVAPSFSVKVNDGVIDSNVLAATISYTPANDTPVVTSAVLTINEGQTVTLSGANFGITDPDNASFTYTASAVTGGFFQLSSAAGTPITTFTSADSSGGLVEFVDDGNEVAPSFSVKVNDGTVDSNVLAATINYTPVNDTPVVTSAALTVNEGQTVTLSGANFGITDPDNASFTYTVSAVTGGYFQLSSAAGTPITSFTSANLTGGLVQFVDDGNEVAPSFSVKVNDGTIDSNGLAASISYTPVNDTPVVTSAALTLNEGQTVTLSGANFGITDPDNASFTYTVSAVTGGYFQLSSAPDAPITTFTGANLTSGLVQFVDDGNQVAPSFSVTANDGSLDSNTLAASISYTGLNNVPLGLPTIMGLVSEDQTLIADTSAISDADGLGPFSFQWLRDGASVAGATTSTYTLGDADVGTQISVRVNYVDAQGHSETVTSTLTAAVLNINDTPLGAPRVTGIFSEGGLLTAGVAQIRDDDGLGAFSYQWLRNGVAIAGANASTYTLSNADGGAQISVDVAYIDGHGSTEIVTSASHGVASSTNQPPVITSHAGSPIVTLATAGATRAVTTITATDFDELNDALRYTIIGGADAGLFEINTASGVLSFAGDLPNFFAPLDADGDNRYEVTVAVADGAGGEARQTLLIDVLPSAARVDINPPEADVKPPATAEPVVVTPAPVTPAPGNPPEERVQQAVGDGDLTAAAADFFARVILGEAESSPAVVRAGIGVEDLAAQLNGIPPNTGEKAPAAAAPSQLARLALANVSSTPATMPPDAEAAPADTPFKSGVDAMRRALADISANHHAEMDLRAQVVAGFGVSLTAGIVQWVLRAGSLMFSFASTLPIWRFFDPLPILIGRSRDEESGVTTSTTATQGAEHGSSPSNNSPEESVERLFEPQRPAT